MMNRKQSPPPTSNIDFHLPEIRHLTLENGLKVIHVNKNKLPIVQLSFIVGAGSKCDPVNKAGLSHLTAMMLDEGAGPYDSLQLDDEFEKLGSILSISNNHDATYISILTLKEHFDRSLKLTSYILKDPKLLEPDFARELQKLQNKLYQMYDDPGYIASTVWERICFEGTPYANPTMGINSDIYSLSLPEVNKFYNSYFTCNNSTLIVVGDLTEDELRNAFKNSFGPWEDKFIHGKPVLSYHKQERKIYLVDKPDTSQSELRIGHVAGKRKEHDYFAKIILNSILGGQFSSRINLNLRENKGYTYGANSSFGYYADAGLFKVSTAVNIENTIDAVKEIFKEIEGIQTNITEEEIDFSKSYLVRGFPSKFETYGQIANNLNLLVIHGLEDKYFDNYIKNISLVTRDEVLETARLSLSPEEMNIVIVGDKNIILPQIESTGFETIEIDQEGNEI